jgi:hypothetical protein
MLARKAALGAVGGLGGRGRLRQRRGSLRHEFFEVIAMAGQLGRRATALGDVAAHRQHGRRPPIGARLGHDPAADPARAPWREVFELQFLRLAAAGHRAQGLVPEPAQRVRHAQFPVRATKDRHHREIGQQRNVVRNEEVPPFEVQAHDDIGQGKDQRALRLLAAPERLACLALLGHVLHHADHPGRPAFCVALADAAAVQHPQIGPVARAQPVLGLVAHAATLQMLVRQAQDPFGVVRVDVARPAVQRRRQFVGAVTQHALELRAEEHGTAADVPVPQAVHRFVEREPQLAFAGLQVGFQRDPPRYVACHRQEVLAASVDKVRGVDLHRHLVAGGVPVPADEGVAAVGAYHGRDLAPLRGAGDVHLQAEHAVVQHLVRAQPQALPGGPVAPHDVGGLGVEQVHRIGQMRKQRHHRRQVSGCVRHGRQASAVNPWWSPGRCAKVMATTGSYGATLP